jgi:signal transduction histidine kinase
MRFIEVTVSDTGIGIAPENLARIFDPFFTTKEVGKGTGLGLAICQSIVEQHRGTIEVQSEGVGQGTAVTVSLPLASDGQLVK